MSQTYRPYIVPWPKFTESWAKFIDDKDPREAFFDNYEEFEQMFTPDWFVAHQWNFGGTGDYNNCYFNFHGHKYGHIKFPDRKVSDYYAALTTRITRFLGEGGIPFVDFTDERIWEFITHAVYSPDEVIKINNSWKGFNWDPIEEEYKKAIAPDYDFAFNKNVVEDWLNLFKQAEAKNGGIWVQVC